MELARQSAHLAISTMAQVALPGLCRSCTSLLNYFALRLPGLHGKTMVEGTFECALHLYYFNISVIHCWSGVRHYPNALSYTAHSPCPYGVCIYFLTQVREKRSSYH